MALRTTHQTLAVIQAKLTRLRLRKRVLDRAIVTLEGYLVKDIPGTARSATTTLVEPVRRIRA